MLQLCWLLLYSKIESVTQTTYLHLSEILFHIGQSNGRISCVIQSISNFPLIPPPFSPLLTICFFFCGSYFCLWKNKSESELLSCSISLQPHGLYSPCGIPQARTLGAREPFPSPGSSQQGSSPGLPLQADSSQLESHKEAPLLCKWSDVHARFHK